MFSCKNPINKLFLSGLNKRRKFSPIRIHNVTLIKSSTEGEKSFKLVVVVLSYNVKNYLEITIMKKALVLLTFSTRKSQHQNEKDHRLHFSSAILHSWTQNETERCCARTYICINVGCHLSFLLDLL